MLTEALLAPSILRRLLAREYFAVVAQSGCRHVHVDLASRSEHPERRPDAALRDGHVREVANNEAVRPRLLAGDAKAVTAGVRKVVERDGRGVRPQVDGFADQGAPEALDISIFLVVVAVSSSLRQ